MGFMDLFSNMSEWDVRDLASGGIIGASLGARLREEEKKRAERPKPGKYCSKMCLGEGEQCTPCLEIQRQFKECLLQLEKLEDSANLSPQDIKRMHNKVKIDNCSLCGAPYDGQYKRCPYCSTAYPCDDIDVDIPASKSERYSKVMKKAEEAWNLYYEKFMLQVKYNSEGAGDDWLGKLQKVAVGPMMGSFQDMLKQTAAEIKQGAEYYGVPMSVYINEVALEHMKTPKTLLYEEENRLAQQNNPN